MPQITRTRRAMIDLDVTEVMTMGELCYAYTKILIDEFNKEPRWTTIHRLRRGINLPSMDNMFGPLEGALRSRFTHGDLVAARELAFLEFYRRVGSAYEDNRAAENGDLFERVKVVP